MPFGVELPDNLGASETQTETGVNPAPEGASPPIQEVSRAIEPEKNQDLDLDKLERFRFQGKEWTPKELRNAQLRHEDYTRKTQELAETRKYSDNFAIDLQSVLRNPNRFEEFRKIYPKQFVQIAEEVLKSVKPSSPTPQSTQSTESAQKPTDPRVEEILSEWGQIKQEQQKAEIEQIHSWLDNQFETLSKKYDFANSEIVTARAEAASLQGTQITKELLDKLFKANHEEIKGAWEKRYKSKVNEQLEKGKKAKDIGGGGGIAGEAPRGLKTLAEAKKAMLADFGAK